MYHVIDDSNAVEWSKKRIRTIKKAAPEIEKAREYVLEASNRIWMAAKKYTGYPEKDRILSVRNELNNIYKFLDEFSKDMDDEVNFLTDKYLGKEDKDE